MKSFRLFPLFALCILVTLMAFAPGRNKKKRSSKNTYPVNISSHPGGASTAENPYYIIIDKSDYELKVFDEEGWYANGAGPIKRIITTNGESAEAILIDYKVKK